MTETEVTSEGVAISWGKMASDLEVGTDADRVATEWRVHSDT